MDGAVWQAESAAHGPPTPTDGVCDLWSVTATILLLSEVQHRKQTERQRDDTLRKAIEAFYLFSNLRAFPQQLSAASPSPTAVPKIDRRAASRFPG